MNNPLRISEQWPCEGSLARKLLNAPHAASTQRPCSPADAPLRVLHLLSQQPGKTGSGVYLQALVQQAAKAGFQQRVIVGIPADSPTPVINPLNASQIAPVRFRIPSIPFPVAGMSDVMPYESTRFSAFTSEMLDSYLNAFHDILTAQVEQFQPHLVHTHHLWLATALTRMLFPYIPVVTTCHGTELRQLELVPALSPFVIPACSKVDRVMALHQEHCERIADRYGMDPKRIIPIGAGYRDDIFCPPHPPACAGSPREVLNIVYAGKLSRAKGVPWLIEAMDRVSPPEGKRVRLLLVGSAGGVEGDIIRDEAGRHGDKVRFLGALSQEELASVLKTADVFVLPSFYEGLPLVILEAIACCCHVVVTDLPGMDTWLPEDLDTLGVVERVPLPRLVGPDTPYHPDLAPFAENLAAALTRQLGRALCETPDWQRDVLCSLEAMTWEGVFQRVRKVYLDVLTLPECAR